MKRKVEKLLYEFHEHNIDNTNVGGNKGKSTGIISTGVRTSVNIWRSNIKK